MQGFPADWTKAAEDVAKPSSRWKLVGNAVTVDTVSWIANKMIHPEKYDASNDKELKILNGLYHKLLDELIKDDIISEISKWMEKRC